MSEVFSPQVLRDIGSSLIETGQMLGISLFFSIAVGIPMGLALFLLSSRHFSPSRLTYSLASLVVNLIRSIPFVILLVLLLPLTQLMVGTTIGSVAAAVPLSVAAVAFMARLAENSFRQVHSGVIEAALATGAGRAAIIWHVLITESLPNLIADITVTTISLIGYTAMAGIVGGGGIGDLAIRFGYYRYQTGVMIFTVAILVVLVQLVQWTGDFIIKKVSK